MNFKSGWKKKVASLFSAGVLAVTGTAAALPSAAVSAADLELDNYAKLLQYSLYFFDANMCGDKAGETSAFSWRDDCHTGDVVAGGFHDAGDNIKCGQTAGFTASTLGWTYYEYEDAFKSTGVDEHYKVVMNYFCDYFKASTTLSGGEVTNFVYEVGNDGADHSTWCAPEICNSRSSSETYSTTNGASDIAAQYAAALAENYISFGDEEDLTYATALYNFATKYRTATSNNNIYYRDGVQDDISWAAGWMYLATGESAYLDESNKYTSYSDNWTNDYFYGNSWLGAAIINAEITGNWSNATNYIDTKVNANQNQFYVMNSWGSARHNTLMQICAMACTNHKEESGKDYSEWCKKQMNYILGDNDASVCLVVGYNDVSATSPHHRAASNITISSDWHEYNNWDGSYSSSNGKVLYGALCGGPTGTSFTTYNDTAKDATSNEVAIDYQVGLVGAAAALYAVYGTGSVVAEIGDTVTVYPSEVAVANGETPSTGTQAPEETTTTTEETTTTTEETTTTTEKTTTTTEESIIVEPADSWASVPDVITVGETVEVSVKSVFSYFQIWKSSDDSILQVRTDGGKTATITGLAPGTVILSATYVSHEIQVVAATTTEITTTESSTVETETTASQETTTTTKASTVTGNVTLYGDVNLDGSVDITDAVLLNKKAAGAVELNSIATANADCDVNGEVNSDDAVLLMRFLVHLVNSIGNPE